MASSSSVVLLLTTLPDDHDLASLARALVDERLAACVSALPTMRSTYCWQGGIEEANERQLIIKTTRSRVEALQARLGELHPYDVPEILVVEVIGGSERYLQWVALSLS